MTPETLESLLEFLTISGRVAVVQLEPPRARAFAEALRRAMEFRDAARAKAVTEEREACAEMCDRVAEVERPMVGTSPEREVARLCGQRIRARGGPVAHAGSPTLREAEE